MTNLPPDSERDAFYRDLLRQMWRARQSNQGPAK